MVQQSDRPELSYRIPHFFDLLGQQKTSIPIQSQWILVFDPFPQTIINQVKQYESFLKAAGSSSWNIKEHLASAITPQLQTVKGCIFAQSTRMPEDGFDWTRVGEYNGGFVKGIVSTARKSFGTFDVSFLETNLSFADLVLRPWAIMASHKSMLARVDKESVKTNITVYHLAKSGYMQPLVVRKQFNFFECVPVSIDTEEYNYTEEKTIQRQVSFLYSYYTIESDQIRGR